MDLKQLSNSERTSLIMGQLAGVFAQAQEMCQQEAGVQDWPGFVKLLTRVINLIEESQPSHLKVVP